jgi:DNA helicase-2/ATP-dependent DNA helicase PcrA
MKPISKFDIAWYNSKSHTDYSNNYETKEVAFKIGSRVSHTIFGEGVVIGINNELLDIAFGRMIGTKTINKNHKALKYISE